MKKLAIFAITMMACASTAFAAVEWSGQAWIGHTVSKDSLSTKKTDFETIRARMYAKSDIFMGEFNFSPSAGTIEIKQFFIKTPFLAGTLQSGTQRTGFGALGFFSDFTPFSYSDLTGTGIVYSQKLDDKTSFRIGGLGTLLADPVNSNTTRYLLGEYNMELMPKTTFQVAGLFATYIVGVPKANKSNLDASFKIGYTAIDNLVVNFLGQLTVSADHVTEKNSTLGVAAKYSLDKTIDVYGEFVMGLDSDTKANKVESDLILGASVKLADVTFAVAEFESAKKNGANTLGDARIGIRTNF